MPAENLYADYVTNQLGQIHRDDYVTMERYFRKNYAGFISSTESRIVDVGCGMGHFLYFLNEEGCKNVVGIDISQECIDYCRQRGLGQFFDLQLIGIDQFFLDKFRVYDLVVLNDVLEHLPKDEIIDTLKNIRKSLADGGKIVIKVVNSANPITGAASRYIDFTHTICFTEESLAQVLRMAGFSEIEIKPQDIWVFNPVVNLFGRWLQMGVSVLFRLLNLLYGRKSTKIFTKDLIAVGRE